MKRELEIKVTDLPKVKELLTRAEEALRQSNDEVERLRIQVLNLNEAGDYMADVLQSGLEFTDFEATVVNRWRQVREL